jgi:hypothetical protein
VKQDAVLHLKNEHEMSEWQAYIRLQSFLMTVTDAPVTPRFGRVGRWSPICGAHLALGGIDMMLKHANSNLD